MILLDLNHLTGHNQSRTLRRLPPVFRMSVRSFVSQSKLANNITLATVRLEEWFFNF